MSEKEQAKPLALGGLDKFTSSNGDEKTRHRRGCIIKCCGCFTALVLIHALVIVILAFTVFRVKEPDIKLNGVTVTKLDLVNGSMIPKPGSNMSLVADVSVKNPNAASFRYTNTTTSLYYHEVEVGEARGPAGRARSRRTMRMNITVDIITDGLTKSPYLSDDVSSGILPMRSYSMIPGRVNILGILKKHIIVKMNCTMVVNISSRGIQTQKCKRKVDLNF